MKKCCKCKTEKENDCFGNCKFYTDGLDIMCKECQHARYKAYYDDPQNNMLVKKKENKKNNLELSILIKLKNRSKENELTFNLTKGDIIIPKFCPILGIELKTTNIRPQDCSPSVDRINNNQGYIKGNIIITSWKANRIKGTADINDMKLIYENFYTKIENTAHENESFDIKRRKLILRSTKNRSILKQLEHNLILEDIKIPNLCPIFGTKLIKSTRGNDPNSASVDRIDNTKGYLIDNIRIISNKANMLKNDSSFEEYEKIYFFYKNLIQN